MISFPKLADIDILFYYAQHLLFSRYSQIPTMHFMLVFTN